jgi:hypothetical protein
VAQRGISRAVVFKNADGSTSVKQPEDLDGTGTLVGTVVGGLTGLLAGAVGVVINERKVKLQPRPPDGARVRLRSFVTHTLAHA